MNFRKQLHERMKQRAKRTRAVIHGTAKTPRLSVHRSNTSIYVQLIDDSAMKTLAAVSSAQLEKGKKTKIEAATVVGEMIGKKAKDLGVLKVIFDRGAYRYHGRVKALAEGARKAGLTF